MEGKVLRLERAEARAWWLIHLEDGKILLCHENRIMELQPPLAPKDRIRFEVATGCPSWFISDANHISLNRLDRLEQDG